MARKLRLEGEGASEERRRASHKHAFGHLGGVPAEIGANPA